MAISTERKERYMQLVGEALSRGTLGMFQKRQKFTHKEA